MAKKGKLPWNTGKKGIHLSPNSEIKKGEHRGKKTEFKKGHISCFKGLTKETNEVIKKISESNKGKPKSKEHRKKLSESRIGKIPWNKGLTKETDERLQKTVEPSRQRALNQHIVNRDTKIELLIDETLLQHNIIKNKDYITHKPILGICIPDKIFETQKIAIFCDGDYWHNLPNYIERDKNQNKVLKENGWIVLRFWEHQIKEDIDSCINSILESLSK